MTTQTHIVLLWGVSAALLLFSLARRGRSRGMAVHTVVQMSVT